MKDPTRSIGDVLKDILEDVQQIVRAEVRLARAEVREEFGKAKSAALFLMMAGAASAQICSPKLPTTAPTSSAKIQPVQRIAARRISPPTFTR